MVNKEKSELLFVAPSLSSFIKNDIALLNARYSVVTNIYPWKAKKLTGWLMLKQLVYLLKYRNRFQCIIVSFGGYWALMPSLIGRIFRIPVFIILHGTDCASIPSIEYGMLRKNILRHVCKWSYSFATLLLPVSKSLIRIENTFYKPEDSQERFQGIHNHFPNLTTGTRTIFNGLDPKFWDIDQSIVREPHSFMAVFSSSQYFLKGGDLIFEMSKRLPQATFYIAGMSKPEHLSEKRANLIFLGKLSPEELKDYYNRCAFYFQLSIYEGFGCALCEAMLCGSIPIGSSVNVIPEIILDSGFIVPDRDGDVLEKTIRNAIAHPAKNELRQKARSRVVKNYSLGIRQERLIETINQICNMK